MQRRSFRAAPLAAACPQASAEPEPRAYAFGDGIPHTPGEEPSKLSKLPKRRASAASSVLPAITIPRCTWRCCALTADPAYLSFEKEVLPEAVRRGIGIQAIKVFGNAFLLRVMNAGEFLKYALNLPIHCAALGASTTGQLDDDVRFKPLGAEEMDELRKIAVTAGPGGVKGPALEYWKRYAEGR